MVQTNTESIRLWACVAQWVYSQIAVSRMRWHCPMHNQYQLFKRFRLYTTQSVENRIGFRQPRKFTIPIAALRASATITASAWIRVSLPSIGSGRCRPDSSGSPNRVSTTEHHDALVIQVNKFIFTHGHFQQ